MGDLDDGVRRREGAGCRQHPLRRRRQVAEQQRRRDAAAAHVEDDAGVVAFREGAAAGLGPEHAPACRAEGAGEPRRRLGRLCPLRRQRGDLRLRVGIAPTVQHGADAAAHGGEAADVVEVVVGEHQQVDALDPGAREAGRERLGSRTGVDERDSTGRAEQHGVPLTDVAREHGPVGRQRPAARDGRESARAQRSTDDHRHERRRMPHARASAPVNRPCAAR